MQYDLAVVGAGTAGAALAAMAARSGLRVLCVDRRPLGDAGARWVNGVPRWMFEEAGLDAPVGPELLGEGHPFHLIAGWGPDRVVVRSHGVLDVDMRLLVARLQADALAAGAELRGEVTVHGAGELGARWVVDASGLTGARLLGQRHAGPRDLCAAAQQVRALRDPAGARAFLEHHGVEPGATACFSAVAGGFSIVSVRIDGDRVSLLTGSLPARGHPSGLRLLESFADRHPWVGEPLFGGARAIPLRPPRGPLARGTLAALGDAAGHVFSPHGSGIGVGLVAARLLADALVQGEGPAGYARAFARRWGRTLRGYDVLRRVSQRLGPRQVAWMMRTGVMNEATVRAVLEQRQPPMWPSALQRDAGPEAKRSASAAG